MPATWEKQWKAIINTSAKKRSKHILYPTWRNRTQIYSGSPIDTKGNNKKHKRNRKKPIYIAYLDVTQAYDKAWLDGIMYAMHNIKWIRRSTRNIIRKFNMDLKAKIKTEDGLTRPIKKLLYPTVMDEIAKELEKKNE